MLNEEWELRKREPMHMGGPISLRYKMPKEWRNAGGMRQYFTFVSVHQYTLPRMPTCEEKNPTYRELMSRKAFYNRCLLTQKKMNDYLMHPMLHDMSEIKYMSRLETRKRFALLSEEKSRGVWDPQKFEDLANVDKPSLIFSAFGSSFGSVSRLQQTG